MSLTQNYKTYTKEDFYVWNQLFERQTANLLGKSHPEYVKSMDKLEPVLNADSIPCIEELNKYLADANGWQVKVVPGLIEVGQFFEFLAEKKFCSSTWLRDINNLEYLEEPDMFHDIFGHIPFLMNKQYARFVEFIGKLGVKYKNQPEILKSLQRLYWYTIEFGLIKHANNIKLYGAGLISSYGEAKHVFEDEVKIVPFDVKSILNEDFIISEMQTKYYMIDSFSQLYSFSEGLEDYLESYVCN